MKNSIIYKILIFSFLFLYFENISFAALPYPTTSVNNNGECAINAQFKVSDPKTGDSRCVGIDQLQNYIISESDEPTIASPGKPATCTKPDQTLISVPGRSTFRCLNNSTYPNIPQELRTTQFRNVIGTGKAPSVSGYQMQVKIPCQPLAGGQCATPNTPAGYIARIYQFGLMIVGFAAFAMIVYGGILYVFAAGDITKTSDARETIINAIYGLVLFLGAYIVLYTINPNLVNLRNPQLEFLRVEQLAPPPEAGQEATNLGSGSGSGGSLCDLTINGSIGISVNTANGSYSGNPTGGTCISCVPNAEKAPNGSCVCAIGFAEFNAACITDSACESNGGVISEGNWLAGQYERKCATFVGPTQ